MTKDVIIRTVITAIALLNSVLVMLGKSPLDLDENTIYAVGSGIAAIITTVWAWWKNNSVTANAQRAQVYLNDLKAEAKSNKKEYAEV